MRTAATSGVTADEALALEIKFQDNVVLDLVRDAKLPIWWSGRPMSLAWVVVEQDTQRTLLRDGGDSELSTALLRQAQRRGCRWRCRCWTYKTPCKYRRVSFGVIFCRPWQPLLTAMGLSN